MSGRDLSWLPLGALVAACGAGPQPPPEEPPAAVSAVPARPKPQRPAPWVELTGPDATHTTIVLHPGGSEPPVSVAHGHVEAAIPMPEGGAMAVIGEGGDDVLFRIDATGTDAWRTKFATGGTWHLARAGTAATTKAIVAFDLREHAFFVYDAKDGDALPKGKLPDATDIVERAGVLVAVDADTVSRLEPDMSVAWRVRLRPFPSLNPFRSSLNHRIVEVGADGTILTGAFDGSLVALDPEGKALFQLGVRDDVSTISARQDGSFRVVDQEGRVTTVGRDGAVSEEHVGAKAPTPTIGVVDHRGAAQPTTLSAAPWRPSTAYRAEEISVAGTILRNVRSVLPISKGEVWALGAAPPKVGASGNEALHLFHLEKGVWSDLGVPTAHFDKEVYVDGAPPEVGTFAPLGLERGPHGSLVVVGTRYGSSGMRAALIERKGKDFQERHEFVAPFAKMSMPSTDPPVAYASSEGGHEIACMGRPAQCVGIGIPSDAVRTLPSGPPRYADIAPVFFFGETPWFGTGSAFGSSDAWIVDGDSLVGSTGGDFASLEAPELDLQSVWASGPNDVWITGAKGLARFDGHAWSRIVELDRAWEAASSRRMRVTGSAADDVWAFGDELWHVTPVASGETDLVGEPGPIPAASSPSSTISTIEVDPSFEVKRTAIDDDSGHEMRGAIDAAAVPGGTAWLYDGARVVEIDGKKSHTIYQAPPVEPFVCWSAPENDCEVCAACSPRRPTLVECDHCLAPTSPGEGAIITEDGVAVVSHGKTAPESNTVSALLAIAAGPSKAFWSVSARADDELPRAFLDDPKGHRLLAGIPDAAYAAVAVRADDDAWIAGGLRAGAELNGPTRPEGEGTLIHFDGKTFARYRAPDGALLATASAGPSDGWAVGLRGEIVHVHGGVVTVLRLATEKTLRSVSASSSGDVWIGGDGGTLLHWSAAAGFRRVDTTSMGERFAVAAVIAPEGGPGWAVGPGGIFQIIHR